MKEKVKEIINLIRVNKGLEELTAISESDHLRNVLEFSSIDLAELTVRIEDEFDIDIFEDGLISTVGEIFEKLK